MKLKPHGYFLVSFVTSFVDGEISRRELNCPNLFGQYKKAPM